MDEVWSRVSATWARLRAGRVGVAVERVQRQARQVGDGLLRARRQLVERVRASWRRGVGPVRPAVDATSSAARHVGDTVRPGTPPILYRDGMVTLDEEGIVVSAYFVPTGRRRIRYDEIRRITEYPLTGGRQWRVHGFGWPRRWYHRDWHRAERVVGLELELDRGWLRPVLTPIEVDVVKQVLAERAPHASSGP
jgi:hypothetical protein